VPCSLITDFKLALHDPAAAAGLPYGLTPKQASRCKFWQLLAMRLGHDPRCCSSRCVPAQVVADFLGQLKIFVVDHIRSKLVGSAGLAATRRDAIQWCALAQSWAKEAVPCGRLTSWLAAWALQVLPLPNTVACRCLTVPAMWTDASKQCMRSAAESAGLASSTDSDALSIILEPEAAVLHALEAKAPPLLPGEGQQGTSASTAHARAPAAMHCCFASHSPLCMPAACTLQVRW